MHEKYELYQLILERLGELSKIKGQDVIQTADSVGIGRTMYYDIRKYVLKNDKYKDILLFSLPRLQEVCKNLKIPIVEVWYKVKKSPLI